MKTSIVTGTAGGIGSLIANRLLEQGDRVVGVDVRDSDHQHPNFINRVCDISDWSQLDNLIGELSDLAPAGVDNLVHCAAIAHTSTMRSTVRQTWEQVIRVNLSATIALLQGLDTEINESGRIVLFGSGTGIRGASEMFAYAASKGGIMALAKSLAHDFSDRKITVNVVSPGFTRTSMTGSAMDLENKFLESRALKRPELPEDLVGITEFLLSEKASFITGQTISVDGGSVKL